MRNHFYLVAVFGLVLALAGLSNVEAQGHLRLNNGDMDERIYEKCLKEESLKALNNNDIRDFLEARSGPYMADIIQTTARVCVPDPSLSPSIKQWTRPLDIGTGTPDYSRYEIARKCKE